MNSHPPAHLDGAEPTLSLSSAVHPRWWVLSSGVSSDPEPSPAEGPATASTFSPGSLMPLLQVHQHIFDALLSISPARFASLSRLCHSRARAMLYRKLVIDRAAHRKVFYGLYGFGGIFALLSLLDELQISVIIRAMDRSWWSWWWPIPRDEWSFRNVTHLRLDQDAVKWLVEYYCLKGHDVTHQGSEVRRSSIREGERMVRKLEMAPRSICLELDLARPRRQRGGYWLGDILLGALVPGAGIQTVTIHMHLEQERSSDHKYHGHDTDVPPTVALFKMYMEIKIKYDYHPVRVKFVVVDTKDCAKAARLLSWEWRKKKPAGEKVVVDEVEERMEERLSSLWEEFRDL
ncbi:hypothetical protein IAT38_006988 [Cryptococcus sp. DSM 104549]